MWVQRESRDLPFRVKFPTPFIWFIHYHTWLVLWSPRKCLLIFGACWRHLPCLAELFSHWIYPHRLKESSSGSSRPADPSKAAQWYPEGLWWLFCWDTWPDPGQVPHKCVPAASEARVRSSSKSTWGGCHHPLGSHEGSWPCSLFLGADILTSVPAQIQGFLGPKEAAHILQWKQTPHLFLLLLRLCLFFAF